MPLFHRIAADVVVALHVAFALFVVAGELLVLVGMLRKWSWTRNFWFRTLHLLAIGYVVAEVLCGVNCPLTVWERRLRELAGMETYSGDFIPNLLHDLLFVEAAPGVLAICYAAFGVLVLLTYIANPPRWPRRIARQRADGAAGNSPPS